jgi:hypothetical protein
MSTGRRPVERRRTQQLALIERRKGRAWLYGQIAVAAALAIFLAYRFLF